MTTHTWKQFLLEARAPMGNMSDREMIDKAHEANNWYSCAIGEHLNLSAVTRRDPQYAHDDLETAIYRTDSELVDKGYAFCNALSMADIDLAEAIYNWIDGRLTPKVRDEIVKKYIEYRRERRIRNANARPRFVSGAQRMEVIW